MGSIRFLWIISAFVLLIFSCKKKISSAGSSNLSSEEYLNGFTVDTFDLLTYTVEEDSIITDNAANVVLGYYNDPEFGHFESSFYTQVLLGGAEPNFGDANTIVLDSFVLSLEYDGYYGDVSPQTFEVYEVDESLSLDSTYYTFSTLSTKSTNLLSFGAGTIVPSPDQNTIVGSDTLSPQLRIPLDTNLARVFIDEAVSGSTSFSDNTQFLEYFKGLYVKTNNGTFPSQQGGVFYFNLNDAASKLTMYFHQDGESKTYDFVMNSEGADFVHVDVDNSTAPIDQVLQDSTLGKVEFFAQAFKHRAAIKIPGLDSIPAKSIIHRADLELPVQYQTGTYYSPGALTSVATRLTAEDDFYTPLSSIGEYVDYKKHFEVDLRQYVQSVLTGQIENTEIVISPLYFINSADRIVFNGVNTTNKNKPKLILTYTPY